jgi:hypothetical protein
MAIKKKHVFHKEEHVFVNYPHFEVELLEKGEFMSRCKHLHTGKEISVFNSLLDFSQEQTRVRTTYINHFMNLDVGESIALVRIYNECALVKYNGEFGWLLTEQLI